MNALIGYTGLVGSTLARSHTFDACFRSADIDLMRNRSFDLVVCAGVRAEKWKANLDPEADLYGIARLQDVLKTVSISRFVLISTVDVYPRPIAVDEFTPIDSGLNHAYGRHRYAFECFCRERFDCTVLRLPGLFGKGLKKNAIFDLMHNRGVGSIHPDSQFAFYNLERVWHDIERVMTGRIHLANVSVEPIRIGDIAELVFNRSLVPPDGGSVTYDVRSRYADVFGGRDGYWYSRESTMREIARFVSFARSSSILDG